MGDLITIIIWVVIAAAAGLWKLFGKSLGGAATAGKVAQAGKRAKGLLDILMGQDFEEVKRMLSGKEETQMKPPEPQEPVAAAPVAKSVVTPSPPQRSISSLPAALKGRTGTRRQPQFMPQKPRRAATERIRPPASVEKRGSLEEAPSLEEGPSRPARPVAEPVARTAPAVETKQPVTAGQKPASVLGLLRGRDPRTLRELMLLGEILGPSKAVARRSGPRVRM